MALPTMLEALRWQARVAREHGSPLYGYLLERMAPDLAAGGASAAVLAGSGRDAQRTGVLLKLLGAVHRLVLAGRAPELARSYPSVGGDPSVDAWPAFEAVLVDHRDELRAALREPLQTNEVRRSAGLLAGFVALAGVSPLPLRLLEIGASAGLNLRWDHYRYECGGRVWGDPASPLVFGSEFSDDLPLGAPVVVAERSGCDPHPIDPGSEAGRLRLRSFVWPDQLDRLARLDAALAVAARVPAPVARAGAADWLAARLDRPVAGRLTVVFHSIVWQYLSNGGCAR